MDNQTLASRGIVVLSGGSAANHLVDVFDKLVDSRGCPLTYVIPISDNGGSSSELIRVFGGPGIGDIRSRLVRLIPSTDPPDTERTAIKVFFNHRLSNDPQAARMEWLDIVEARHELWDDISSAKKELIRSFLNSVNFELVKRVRPSSVFNFQGASVGNMFLTGARLFSGSFESAIYLLSSICTIPSNISVLPAINTNFSHHICAALANGDTLAGQNTISHPSEPTALTQHSSYDIPVAVPRYGKPAESGQLGTTDASITQSIQLQDLPLATGSSHRNLLRPKPLTRSPTYNNAPTALDLETQTADTIEDANLPGSLPTLRKPYITFSKTPTTSSGGTSRTNTPAPTVTAISVPTHTLLPTAILSHPQASLALPTDSIVPSQENQHTALLPSRITQIYYINPYGHAIRPPCNTKIPTTISSARAIIYSIGSLYTSLIPSLILRGVGAAIASRPAHECLKIFILNGSCDRETSSINANGSVRNFTALDFIRAVVRACLESQGEYSPSDQAYNSNSTAIQPGTPVTNTATDNDENEDNWPPPSTYSQYITHLIHVSGPGAPQVDREKLAEAGIECVRVIGRKSEDGEGMRYDAGALAQALEALVGRKEQGHRRRNTLERW